jgi:hypothetical protein
MKHVRAPLASFLAALLLALPSTAPSATTCVGMEPLKPVHRIWGVIFLSSGDRLANATVSVLVADKEIAVTKSDDHGKFSFDRLKAGHYELRIRLEELPSGVAGAEVVLVRPNAKSKREIAVNFKPGTPACSSFSLENAHKFEAELNP